jgi:oligoribonuclease
LQQWVQPGAAPLAGTSIGQDRRFLVRYMPQLAAFFHYRSLDVSTLKILADAWRPDIKAGFQKRNSHRALDDVYESIAELRYYRTHFLNDDADTLL